MAEPFVIFGVQYQDGTEPWGWETLLHTTSEVEARRVYEEKLDNLRRGTIHTGEMASLLQHELDEYRLVRINVYGELTGPERESLGDWGGEAFGVEEIERGGRGAA